MVAFAAVPSARVLAGLTLLAALGSPSLAAAQSASLPVKLNGEVRVRSEVDDRSSGRDADLVSLLRTRLGITASPSEGVRAVIQLSDSRAFGEEGNTLSDASADRFDLNEGYLEWQSSGGTRLRVGRQGWAYGDERLIGTVGWANVTRSFDGVQLQVPVSGWTIDGFAATIREFDAVGATGVDPRQNEGVGRDQSIFGLWASDGDHDLFAVAETRVAGSGVDDVFRRTIGAHGHHAVGGLMLDATIATQFGTQRHGGGSVRDISAWMMSGSIARQFAGSLSPTLGVQADLLSGDDDPLDDTDKAFNTLYGTNHKFYGFMDLVLDPAGQLGGRGLADLMVRGSIRTGGWRIGADFHQLSLMEAATGASKRLGTEIDLTASRTLARGLGLVTGASLFSPGDSGSSPSIGLGDDTLRWGYVQLTVTF